LYEDRGASVTAARLGLSQSAASAALEKLLAIEFRWSEGGYDRLHGLAADLVRHQVTIILATGAGGGANAAKTTTIGAAAQRMHNDPLPRSNS
jgi:hypothetical protein